MMHFEQSLAYFSHECSAWKTFVTTRIASEYRRRGFLYDLGEYTFTNRPYKLTNEEIDSIFENRIKSSNDWLEPIVAYYREIHK